MPWLSRTDFRHVVIAYGIIALLLLGMMIPMYLYADHLFVESEMNRWQLQLDRGSEELSSTLAGIGNAVNATREGVTFLPLRYPSDEQFNPITLLEQQRILKGFFIQQDAVLTAGLVFSSDLVLSSENVFYPDSNLVFYPSMLRCGDLSYDEWIGMLQAAGTGFLPEMKYKTSYHLDFDALTYTMPWGTSATMYALIRTSDIREMFMPSDMLEWGSLRLSKRDGSVLYACGPEPDSRAYQLSASVPNGNVQAALFIPRAVINQNLSMLRRMVILYISIVLLLAITLTVAFAFFAASKPLASLSARLPGVEEKRALSLRDSYRNLADGITSMGQTIDTQRTALVYQHFELALFRGFLSEEENRQFLHYMPHFPEHYRLILYRLEGGNKPELQTQIIEMCRSFFTHSPIHPIDRDGVLLVLEENCPSAEAARLLEEMNRKLPAQVHASATEVHHGLDGLHPAWIQLINIECCAQEGEQDHVLTTRDLPEIRMPVPLSIQDLQTIYDALMAANLPLALSVLESCTDALMHKEENIRLYHHTYQLLHRMLRQLQLENPVTLGALAIPAYVSEDRNELFATALPACFEAFCDAIRSSHASAGGKNTPMQIISYINERLSSPGLCVESVASHFGISASTLQRLCREATGTTVAAHIETQRLTKAYRLLTQTDSSIAQVAQECGFNSPNSFYKAFKRRYGMAPRSLNEKNETSAGL